MKILLLPFICLMISLDNSLGQEVTLKLNPNGKPAQERNYVFKEVKDSRVEKSIGQVYDPQRNKYSANFGGELAQQAYNFYNARITSDNLPPHEILVKIYNLDLKEIYQADRRGYKGEIQLSMGFFVSGENEPVHLVDFNSKLNYGRPANQMHYIEASIGRLFENSWEYFDAWLATQYQSNRSLVKKVRLNILDPKRQSTKDTVFYDPDRPLTWADFTDKPNAISSFNAAIFSSLSIEGSASIQNGEIVQTIDVKVYMLPNQSWVKDADDYASNHEQRHFDLTRIAADRMIFKLKNLDLEPNLYEATLNDIYLDAYREMNHLQEFYDNQTSNGRNKGSQARWNQLIEEALSGKWEELDRLLETKEKDSL
ncbi:hypothetical protein SYJ56_09210 [Algoriphagus sp. D3-2-R+10]|uniref:hypothetical protein n=1 Tax=Algoriphagus aurantiacus TaxID=3103948 RepID=UPI002B3EDDEF|nr:hypothetical protein [Algoriphagus sp. D3-2-R+10]MEB2775486.1 hypothetical protein [Algoriphagus sp. D3-2-R+10]